MNEVDEFILEHFGVKGMKWGVRKKKSRAQNKDARVKRLKSGKGTLKDKLMRDLDIGGTNTAIAGPASTKKRVTMGVAALAMMGIGGIQVARILQETGHLRLPKTEWVNDFPDYMRDLKR